MSMKSMIKELKIIDKKNNTNIFNGEVQFEIPLYQRAYAWEDKQIIQLLEDINDINKGDLYYIGSIIVSDNEGKLEIIDGQQRLTSLYLLLNCLNIKVEQSLSFACREKSNYTLRNISDIINETEGGLEISIIDSNIRNGIKVIKENLSRKNFNKEKIIENLSHVILFQINVPENTDLNRYFEIMNTRGEQLEQHDILKAILMDYLGDNTEKEKELFSIIWNACSDMDGYVQMHFVSKNNQLRKVLFGDNWNDIPADTLKNYSKILFNNNNNKSYKQNTKISDIINSNFKIEAEEGYNEEEDRVRFESIISFPYFLLHSLKVFVIKKGIRHQDPKKKIIDDLLDDKKLIDSFKNIIDNGTINNHPICKNTKKFVMDFIIFLLQIRVIFDQFIIKREYANNSTDGEWSLKTLYVSGQGSQKKPYFKNSLFIKPGEWDKTNKNRYRTNLMLQSALRVSYTSPKVMHWITSLLFWLTKNCFKIDSYKKKGYINDNIIKYSQEIENIAITEVKHFIETDNYLELGTSTPHIIFNYLDYLLWERDWHSSKKYEDFTFEFRNSVEHWYPQNPSEGTLLKKWDKVDRFGNLCIIQRNVNSKFSNLPPESKKSTYNPLIKKGSLKLREMSCKTSNSKEWKDYKCAELENEMINLLKSKIN